MPRRLTNPFAGSSPSPSPPPTNEKATALPKTAPRPSRFVQYFLSKPKSDSQTATSALLAAAATQQQALLNSPSPQISIASLSLPTISLSTATADSTNTDDPPTTLFQPPSPAEARRIAKQHAQFGPIGSQSHRYHQVKGESEIPIVDEPPYYYLLTTYISYLILVSSICPRKF